MRVIIRLVAREEDEITRPEGCLFSAIWSFSAERYKQEYISELAAWTSHTAEVLFAPAVLQLDSNCHLVFHSHPIVHCRLIYYYQKLPLFGICETNLHSHSSLSITLPQSHRVPPVPSPPTLLF